ncbi:hypothetical protein KP509_31G052700 [Ceratopteris richardii]|nr:hypothetical protein KP509_31G052700 [Ceratopteris richardii]
MTENVFEMSDVDHSIYLDLVAKVDCCKKASQYLLRIPKQLQSNVVYSVLFAAYLEHGKESSAKRLLLQVRALDLGDQIFLFNQLLAFYKGKGRISEVANLLKEMEDTGVQANLSTYNIILDLRARKGDISGMRKLWKHLEEVKIAPDAASYALLAKGYMKAGLWDRACRAVKEIETIPFSRKRVVYRWLLKLHAQLNRADDLERIWNMLKDVSKLSIDDYSIMVECLGKADEVERAEEIFKEGVHSFGIKRLHQYHTLISVLLDHGRMEKVEALVKEMMRCPFNLGSATYHQLIELYAKSGDQEKAMQTLQKAQNASKIFSGQKPWYISYLTLLEMFGRKGDIERAELIVRDLKHSGYPCGFRIYNALLMAYVKARKMPHGFLDRMRADGAIPNSQMRKELNKVMDNRRELYQMNGARRYLF